MGIDAVAFEIILRSVHYLNHYDNCITLGRQGLHRSTETFNNYLLKYNLPHLIDKYTYGDYCEPLFYDLGFKHVDSIDYSSYESANIIFNLNNKIPNNIKQYDLIFDGGTIEHIFNIPQLFDNIINMLKVGGIFISVTTNNNFSGHGFYQFSPEIFLSCFSEKYGMQVLDLYLAQVDTESNTWINIINAGTINGRQCSKFNSTNETYILIVAKKISDNRISLLDFPPNQYSYENIEWVDKSQ